MTSDGASAGTQDIFRWARPSDNQNRNQRGESATTGITVTTPTGANVSTETRPVNSAVNYIIKY